MLSVPLAENVSVSIVSAIVQTSPPAWHLEYEVHNLGSAVIWLVVDESLVLLHDESHIELSYARGKMQPGVQVFGYFNPAAVKVPPGESLRQSVEITWPCRLSDIWNAKREAAPTPGDYDVSVRIGFALTPAPNPPEAGEDVETPVLRWQKEALSPTMRIAVPPYASAL